MFAALTSRQRASFRRWIKEEVAALDRKTMVGKTARHRLLVAPDLSARAEKPKLPKQGNAPRELRQRRAAKPVSR